jgi:hypothetical protein
LTSSPIWQLSFKAFLNIRKILAICDWEKPRRDVHERAHWRAQLGHP